MKKGKLSFFDSLSNGATTRFCKSIIPIPFIGIGCALLAIKWQLFINYSYTSDVFSYSRALANTLSGRFMWDPTHGYLFGNHAYIFLLLFLPIYLLWNSAFVLIGSSVFAHLLSTFFIFRLSSKIVDSSLVGYSIAVAYFFNPFILEQVLMPVYGFQPDVWAPAFIFSTLYFYFSGKMPLCIAALGLLASVKEEFALLSVGIVALLALDFLYERMFPAFSMGHGIVGERKFSNLILLGVCGAVFTVTSFGILLHAKKVTEFAFAPSLSVSQLTGVLNASLLPEAFNHLFYYLPSAAYIPLLFPEIIIVVLLRIALNFLVYQPHSPSMMSMGAGWSWGNVAVINLLFLGFIAGIKRAHSVFKIPKAALLAIACGAVCWNVYAIATPNVLGFKPASQVWSEETGALADSTRGLRSSMVRVQALLTESDVHGVLIISPYLFMEFPDRDAAVFGFAKNVNPRLLSQAQAAVFLQTDSEGVKAFEERSDFQRVYSDENVSVFLRKAK